MDLDNKLKGMPKVYYFNLDNRTDRRKYMEKQFNKFGIEYTRLSGTKYLGSKIDEWNHLIVDFDEYTLLPAIAANAISHLEFLKKWYTETDEPHLILMEDDYDLNLISRWHFDWNYLMERLPYDWDCLHMGFENPEGLPMYLHPIQSAHDFGPILIHREYVEKLIDLHCDNDRYRLLNTVANAAWNSGEAVAGSGTVDYFMVHTGRTYCVPLISINPNFGSFEDNSLIQNYYREGGDVKARNAYYFWWQHERDRFTLDDFFTYGSGIDTKMTLDTEKFLHYDISGEMYKLYGEPYLKRYRTR